VFVRSVAVIWCCEHMICSLLITVSAVSQVFIILHHNRTRFTEMFLKYAYTGMQFIQYKTVKSNSTDNIVFLAD